MSPGPESAPGPGRGLWTPKGAVAVLDTSILVRAFLSRQDDPSPSRLVLELAGRLYDSFTSEAILRETLDTLTGRRFNVASEQVTRWLAPFVRVSRQVDPEQVPGDFAAALHGDEADNPILKTALALYVDPDGQAAIQAAMADLGCYVVSVDNDFSPGRNVWGWTFIRPHVFLGLLRARGGHLDPQP